MIKDIDAIFIAPLPCAEFTKEQLDELAAEWGKLKFQGTTIQSIYSPAELSIHTVQKDGFSLLLFKSDNMDCGQLDAIHVILRERGVDNAMVMCLPEGDGFEVLTAEQTLHTLKPAIAALSDADLESAGLQRTKPKRDIFDINRSFS